MNHTLEFSQPSAAKDADRGARELASCYARVFLGDDDGKRVLEDLRKKFGLDRLVFQRTESGRYDTLGAALTEGQRQVMSEIENALKLGAPSQGLLKP